ncbi:MAG: hypothetical protein AAGA53_17015 [Pseudomonadota bacterium]
MSNVNEDHAEQIRRPLLGRALRALAAKPIGTGILVGDLKSAVKQSEDLCVTSACRKSGTIAL